MKPDWREAKREWAGESEGLRASACGRSRYVPSLIVNPAMTYPERVHSLETQACFASRDKEAVLEALAALRREHDVLISQPVIGRIYCAPTNNSSNSPHSSHKPR